MEIVLREGSIDRDMVSVSPRVLCNASFPYLVGVANGSCNNSTHTCFVKAWCPVEEEDGDIV